MQDSCAHLLLTLQQCPLFVESECDALSVYVRELLFMLEQEECQLSVSDLLNSLHSVGYLWVERYLH